MRERTADRRASFSLFSDGRVNHGKEYSWESRGFRWKGGRKRRTREEPRDFSWTRLVVKGKAQERPNRAGRKEMRREVKARGMWTEKKRRVSVRHISPRWSRVPDSWGRGSASGWDFPLRASLTKLFLSFHARSAHEPSSPLSAFRSCAHARARFSASCLTTVSPKAAKPRLAEVVGVGFTSFYIVQRESDSRCGRKAIERKKVKKQE